MNMDDSSASYIHMVHHLIEECLIFNMSKEECMEALSKHFGMSWKKRIRSSLRLTQETETKELQTWRKGEGSSSGLMHT
ncbi:hypothetical protein E1A91_A04G105600v1 [Gossypium mustelinum]|uniref:Uncharacterized protein n=1 Tax=Gossypium mustelinum TaxID=34275 RepID=A0A5D2ZMI0_GOSMU|nr:hypothetical protein E1A91_A04G105600v1 [Gossypium mustelinum]